MTVLPSPIPHPLDFCPWQLPGWVYEALDWVVGVEWPEGNEKAVWDLADQWYSVAATLAGPRADAVAAAGQVRSGYGAVGAVAEAFDTAWKKVAEGDEAPLPLLLAVSTDLGQLVEECGCDIEGAKLEVWIELGILVVELLAMTVAVVLTAGAASPAAAAAITATRLIVQQIFRKLVAQLARKSLKAGMKEATERAAKQVTRDGLRGLGRNALRGGLLEAAEEGGVNLAVQGYQNTTGRRDGLDLAEMSTSTVGGFAGGAAAPLAGLGMNATSRGGRIAEHFGRGMGGEVIAEQAASLATGGGFIGLEDAARAAASGTTGSAVTQADAALQARLDGRLSTLAGTPLPPPPAPPVDTGPPPTPVADPLTPAVAQQRTVSDLGGTGGDHGASVARTSGVDTSSGLPAVESRTYGTVESSDPMQRRVEEVLTGPVSPEPVAVTARTPDVVSPPSVVTPVTPAPTLSAITVDPALAATPVTPAPVDVTQATGTSSTAPAVATTAPQTVTSAAAPSVGPGPAPSVTPGPGPSASPGPAPTVATTPTLTTTPGPTVTPNTAATAGTTSTPATPSPQPVQQVGTGGAARTTMPARPDTSPTDDRATPRLVNDLSLLEVLAPKTRSKSDATPPPPPGAAAVGRAGCQEQGVVRP
ncbi:hypothetical protein [Micromonospora cathayae]|uniref:Outer membrane channel protein CpnT-like N-terminal domain-containing protein n=1 Tax=Micromonospora cathayae TaxID=3028804 RepID=A0ABY7ZVA3_9ACTN|nr:hypothetical protein [Micromonospora sp. HUAS 3]WDZ86975.1 hypothetical protein PVK37_11520 [Micromonospora sp. HUAS 3]